MNEPSIALRVREHEEPALEVRVNFGVFAGRQATRREIEGLAARLREELPSFSLLCEERHEFGGPVEAVVQQVVIEVPRQHAGVEPDVLAERIVLAAGDWADACIASRHGGGEL